MSAPLQTTLRTVLLPFATALALACGVAHAAPAQEDNGVNVLHAAQSLYVGDVGQGNEVLLVLKPAGGRKLAGSYHYARGWSQDELALAGDAINQQVVLRETLITEQGKHSRSGVFRGQISADGSTITGTWISTDGRRKLPFTLTRAATWSTQSVAADGGVRSCERPRFADTRYERLNRELAEACDYFLADGHEGPGRLHLEIDSLGQYMVAAIAYAENSGRELPPETIAVDLGATEDAPPELRPAVTAIASHP